MLKAIIQNDYGSPEVFELKEIERPAPMDGEVQVRVHAAGLHAGDLFTMKGVPYLVRLHAGWPKPKTYVPGFDVAGRVEAIGKKVTRFKPGDDIFGACEGACAEFVCVAEKALLAKPADISFEQAAVVPTSGITALRGIRNEGKVRPGRKVLINGASGGVGTFAVQIAKALGAEVTGVCSTKKMDLVRSLGADHVIDYTQEDFTQIGQRYDLILDHAANHTLSDCRRALTPHGLHLPNSGLGGVGYVLKAMVLSMFLRRQGRPFIVTPNHEDLAALTALIAAGKVTPVIDRTYPLQQTPEAFRYLDEGRAQGKVVIALGEKRS